MQTFEIDDNKLFSLDGTLTLDIEAPTRKRSLFAATTLPKVGLYDNITDYMNYIVYPRVETFPTYSKLPKVLDFSNLLTKQENLHRQNSCASWSVTTYIESVLWKLTGKKREFTDAEVFNIYWDDLYMLKLTGALSTAYVGERLTANEIKAKIQNGTEGSYFPNGSITTSVVKAICEYNNNLQLHSADALEPSEICLLASELIGSTNFIRYGYGPDNSVNGANKNTRQIYDKEELKSFLYRFGPSIIQVYGHAMLCYGYNEKGILCRNSWGNEPQTVSTNTQVQQAIYHNIPWSNLILGNTTVNTTFTNANGLTVNLNAKKIMLQFMDIVAYPNAFRNL